MIEAEVNVMKVAGERHGLLSRPEALKGLSEHRLRYRVATGAWVRVRPSVYRVGGAPETWRQRLEALLMWAGARAALSHRTAAALHGFKLFEEGPLDLTTTRFLRPRSDLTLHRVRALLQRDVTTLDDLKVTSATRTLIDLSALNDVRTMRATIDQALREKKTTCEKLEEAVSRSMNRPGVIDVRSLLREFAGAGGPTESELEALSLRLILESGLPAPKVQWAIIAGRKQRRLDLMFIAQRVVVEVDGYAWHSGVDSFEDDRERSNGLMLSGLSVLHWTWRTLHDRPDELIAELYAALHMRR